MGVTFKHSFRGDKLVWIIFTMLSLISIVAVFSSTAGRAVIDGTTIYAFLLKQVVFVILGFIAVYIFHNIPISLYRRFALLGLLAAIGLMLLLQVVGTEINQGIREFRVPGLGRFQPQDFVKVALIVYLAKTIEDGGLDTYKQVFIRLVMPIAILCLLFFRGNISASVIIAFSGFWVLILSGIKKRYVVYSAAIGLAFVGLLLVLQLGFGVQVSSRLGTAQNRLGVGTSPVTNTESADTTKVKRGFTQQEYAQMAIAGGGLFGKGPGKSTQRYILANAHSDFIYAIIIEEYGLIGGIVVLLAYLWLLYRAVMIAKKCTRMFPIILVLGLMLLIVFQAMINMAVSVGVFPVTGQPLPLVSQGGSSMLFLSAAFGVILAVSRTADQQTLALEQPKEETESLQENQTSQ